MSAAEKISLDAGWAEAGCVARFVEKASKAASFLARLLGLPSL